MHMDLESIECSATGAVFVPMYNLETCGVFSQLFVVAHIRMVYKSMFTLVRTYLSLKNSLYAIVISFTQPLCITSLEDNSFES